MYPFIKSCTFFERLWPYGYGHRIHRGFPFFERNPWLPHCRVCCCLSKPKSTRWKPRSTKIITHKHKDMPTITKTKFWNPNPKLNPVFFNNYIEKKLKNIQQLHRDKTQTQIFQPQTQNSTQIFLGFLRNQTQYSKLKSQINEQNPRSKTTNNHRFRERERELGFCPWV